jgi:hypothetical protein
LQGKEKLAVETFLRDFDSRDKNIDFDWLNKHLNKS